ncbi:MAG TPA: AAA family ATPase [Plasticicumulans sp.]|nr:AAA family ATPase [Plasticicumulans sp.]
MSRKKNQSVPQKPQVDRSQLLKRMGLVRDQTKTLTGNDITVLDGEKIETLQEPDMQKLSEYLQQIEAAISACDTQRQAYDSRLSGLKTREIDVQLQMEFSSNLKKELDAREHALLKSEAGLEVRETEARNGFVSQQRQALSGLRAEIARLETEREAVVKHHADDERAARARIAAEHESFLAEQAEQQKKLAADQAEVRAAARRLDIDRNAFEADRRDQQALEHDLRRALEEEHRRERSEERRRIERLTRQAGEDAHALQQQRQQLEGYEDLDRLLQQSGFATPAHLLSRFEEYVSENRRLREAERTRPLDDPETEIETLRDRCDDYRRTLDERDRELNALRDEVARSRIGVLERQTAAQEKRVLEAHRRTLESAITDLERRLDDLTERQQGSETFPALSAMDREFTRSPVLEDVPTLADFAHALRQRIATVTGVPLHYPEQTIRLFLGGLAMSRLHILQGISGTGKTSLAVAFAKAVGGHCTVVPVQAGWRDRDDLLGHFNAFERRYYERECLQAIYRAGTPGYRDRINVVVLDEMNLSHPEQYFAEFLSALERRPDEREIVLTETACPKPPALLRDGRKLALPDNLWFIGTANEDETTFGFADKTIDRAHVMELPRSETAFVPQRISDTPVYRIESLRAAFGKARNEHEPEVAEALKAIRNSEFAQQLDREFGLGWGNRLERQAKDFVPVVIEAGGSLGEAFDHLLVSRLFRAGKITGRFDVAIEALHGLETALTGIWKQVDSKDALPVACLERLEHEIRRKEQQG